jgi:hypothetical protein
VDGTHVGVGVGDKTLVGGLYVEVKVNEGDLQTRVFDISGTKVGFRNAAFSTPGGQAKGDPWSGEAILSEGSLQTTVPGSLTSKVTLKLTDSRPVVSVFASNYTSVRWFKGLLDVKDVTGGARFSMDGTTTVIDGMDLRGKGLQVLGRMRLKGGRLDGAFYTQIHSLSAAVSIENGRRHWKLINARKWYDALP